MRNPTRMRGRWPSGETRHCEIKTAPEKMHWAAFTTETRAKFLENAIALHEHAPEPGCMFAVVRPVFFILIKRDRILNLVRRHVDLDRQLQIIQRLHDSLIELHHRLRL